MEVAARATSDMVGMACRKLMEKELPKTRRRRRTNCATADNRFSLSTFVASLKIGENREKASVFSFQFLLFGVCVCNQECKQKIENEKRDQDLMSDCRAAIPRDKDREEKEEKEKKKEENQCQYCFCLSFNCFYSL